MCVKDSWCMQVLSGPRCHGLTHGGTGAGGLVRGSITVDGHPKVHETFRRIASYVEQFDIHSPGATVHEALLFSAQLRLIGVSKPDARKFVDEARSPHAVIV